MPSTKKAVRKKETRSEREKRRYDAVVKATYDTQLAKRLRGWSDERIYTEYGIKTYRRVKRPDLRKIDRQKIKRKQREWELKLEKYNYLRIQGFDPETAKKYRQLSWDKVASLEGKRIPVTQSQWEKWTSKKNFPSEIMLTVKAANNWYRKHLPKGQVESEVSRWGFVVAWYVHVIDYDFYMAIAALKPDMYDADIYEHLRPKPDPIRA